MPVVKSTRVQLFEAWITVDHDRLPEYAPEYDPDTNTWTCWVSSEVDKHFVVHWRNFGRPFTSGAFVYVDGEFADGKLLMRHNPSQTTFVNGKRTTSATVARFYFQPIVLTDEENPFVLEDNTTVNALGEIKLVIQKGKNTGAISYEHGAVREAKAVNERTKKAGGHRVQYADEVADMDAIGASFEPDSTVMPLTFIFKYRSKERGEAVGGVDLNARSLRSRHAMKEESNVKEELGLKEEPGETSLDASASTSRPRTRSRTRLQNEEEELA
ncbi:hypothetical protein DACRYDRAFT_17444 [Dacryopinax primogenitus]|uniref:DUF7918 domain-containing protein n=1 Tax=Dacryopinax primogenitus (strain DJM 731) TaxID=1858805 RepID=M5FQP7_DACPD|nr:uncharacterized protein DACRYDRAFT_17444 [Dacryopinax primogenitus]EJT99250.1 hypothetical protein DACRYDRAFT_17444 [Dacryopinax primogenitus]